MHPHTRPHKPQRTLAAAQEEKSALEKRASAAGERADKEERDRKAAEKELKTMTALHKAAEVCVCVCVCVCMRREHMCISLSSVWERVRTGERKCE